MKTLTKRKTKIWLLAVVTVLTATILVLSGVGIGLYVAKKNDKSKGEINPLDFSIDAWDGTSVNDKDFNKGFAGR